MADPPLFIGVVSHPHTRYMVNQGHMGLGARLAEAIPGSILQINTDNPLDELDVSLTSKVVQQSLTAEARLEKAWARYLGTAHGVRWQVHYVLRRLRIAARSVMRPSTTGIRRLLNIELSHLDLMRKGVSSGAPWVLILEDDAGATDVRDLVSGLEGLMGDIESPGFVNLSRSFTPAELGLDSLLSDSGLPWQGSEARRVLISDRPATNTVCAILYSREYLAELLRVWEALPLLPVIPIDWKLNQVLMSQCSQRLALSPTSWFVEPAPIIQMSMNPAGILTT
jgi:hypothetical protein